MVMTYIYKTSFATEHGSDSHQRLKEHVHNLSMLIVKLKKTNKQNKK